MKKETKKANASKVGIEPLADRVLIKEDTESKEKKTSGGIIIPITVTDDKGARQGTVIAVGPGRFDDGELMKPGVSVGDKVLFSWADKIKVNEEEYHLVRESEILAVIK